MLLFAVFVQIRFRKKCHVSFRYNEWKLTKRNNRTLARSTNNKKRFGPQHRTGDPEFLETELNYLEGELSLREKKEMAEIGSSGDTVILLFAPSGCKEHVQLAGRLRSHWDVIKTTSENDAFHHICEGTISLVVICKDESTQLSQKIIQTLKKSALPVLYTDENSTDEMITRVRVILKM